MAISLSRLAVKAAEESAEPCAASEATCASCRYFQARNTYRAAEKLGQCRAHPAGPIVQASAWCGEHQAREA